MRIFGVSVLTIALVYAAYWLGRRGIASNIVPA